MDTAEQLWGSDIYYAFQDDHELLEGVLKRITDATLAVSKEFRKYATDRLAPFAIAQHGYMIPGNLLIRNDSAIMLSPLMYREFVQPHDARLLKGVGGGSIHFCGKGGHLAETMAAIPNLRGLDVSQPDLNDIQAVYATCRRAGAALPGLIQPKEELISGKATTKYPTGCVFCYKADTFEEAAAVVRAYDQRS